MAQVNIYTDQDCSDYLLDIQVPQPDNSNFGGTCLPLGYTAAGSINIANCFETEGCYCQVFVASDCQSESYPFVTPNIGNGASVGNCVSTQSNGGTYFGSYMCTNDPQNF
jgi:hypothetical protein